MKKQESDSFRFGSVNYSMDTCRILPHDWHYCILCFFLILLGIFGCGDDEVETSDDEVETPDEAVDTSAKIIGTWELITIDGKKPKAYIQQDIENEATEVLEVENKMIFASNGIFRQEASITTRLLIDDVPSPIYLRSHLHITTKGRYAVSFPTIVLISDDDSDVKLDISLETPGNPELKKQLEQQAAWKQLKAETQQEAADDFRLNLNIHTLELEGDILTPTNDSEIVYKKR